MFRVTTMDMENVPKTENGAVDYTQDFFGKETSLTVSGQLNARHTHRHLEMFIHLDLHSAQRTPTQQDMRQSSGC